MRWRAVKPGGLKWHLPQGVCQPVGHWVTAQRAWHRAGADDVSKIDRLTRR